MLKITGMFGWVVVICMVSLDSIAQNHCIEALRIGVYDHVRNSMSVASTSEIHNEICSAYNRYESDSAGGGASASYGLFSGSASFSREQIEALGKTMCRSDYSDQAASDLQTYASSLISPSAMQSYRRCIELSTRGLKIEISARESDFGAIIFTLSYLTDFKNRPRVTGIQIDPPQEISCRGGLWDAVGQSGDSEPVVLDSAMSMLCTRSIHSTPVAHGTTLVLAKPASILIETEAGSIRHHLAPVPVSPGEDQLSELRKQVVPVGGVVLMSGACPTEYYADVTEQFSGRYLFADSGVTTQASTVDADGSHAHSGGSHEHTVTGTIGPRSGGKREGKRDRGAAHNGWPVTGTAHASEHSHSEGQHQHSYVGFRLCMKTSQ